MSCRTEVIHHDPEPRIPIFSISCFSNNPNRDKFGEILTHSKDTRPEGKGLFCCPTFPYGGCIGIWTPQLWNWRDEYGKKAAEELERMCETLSTIRIGGVWIHCLDEVETSKSMSALSMATRQRTTSRYPNCQKHGMTTQSSRVSNSFAFVDESQDCPS